MGGTGGCGGGANNSGATCEGETSADLSSGGATVVIPEGQLDSCANASPALLLTTTSATLGDNDVVISADGNSVQLNLGGDFGATTVPGDDEGKDTDITIVLPYDDSAIGAGNEDSLHVYVLAKDLGTSAVTPLVGDLDTDANTITLSTKGLPVDTIFTVVYNANMDASSSDDPEILELRTPKKIAALTKLTKSTWPTNAWCVVYDSKNATLRSVVAGILGKDADSLTKNDIKKVVRDRVTTNAKTSGLEYQALEFRAPHLYSQSADKATRACSGTSSSVYFVQMVYSAGSYFQPDDPSEHLDTDTLAGFGTKFGRLYVDANRLDDDAATGLGTVEASIAHEMFHGIQAGYELFRSSRERVFGVIEGTAATIGKTLDGAGTNGSEPLVRNFADEIFDLSNYLLNGNDKYSYSNQDFFAYLARRHNGNSFDFLPSYFAAIKTRVDALTSDADVRDPPWATLYGALDDGIKNGIDASLDLPTVYLEFATDRLVEHSAKSQFGRTGEVTTAGTLATGLLTLNSGLLSSLSGDANFLNVSETSNSMASYQTRVFQVIPTGASIDSNGRRLKVTVIPSAGTFGSDFRVKYYREGSASGTTAAAEEFEVSNWGITTSDEIIVVVSNTQAADDVTFTYAAVTEEETDGGGNCSEGLEAGCESQWGPIISGGDVAVGCRSNLCTVDCNLVGMSAADCRTTLTGYLGWSCNGSNQCSMGIVLQGK